MTPCTENNHTQLKHTVQYTTFYTFKLKTTKITNFWPLQTKHSPVHFLNIEHGNPLPNPLPNKWKT